MLEKDKLQKIGAHKKKKQKENLGDHVTPEEVAEYDETIKRRNAESLKRQQEEANKQQAEAQRKAEEEERKRIAVLESQKEIERKRQQAKSNSDEYLKRASAHHEKELAQSYIDEKIAKDYQTQQEKAEAQIAHKRATAKNHRNGTPIYNTIKETYAQKQEREEAEKPKAYNSQTSTINVTKTGNNVFAAEPKVNGNYIQKIYSNAKYGSTAVNKPISINSPTNARIQATKQVIHDVARVVAQKGYEVARDRTGIGVPIEEKIAKTNKRIEYKTARLKLAITNNALAAENPIFGEPRSLQPPRTPVRRITQAERSMMRRQMAQNSNPFKSGGMGAPTLSNHGIPDVRRDATGSFAPKYNNAGGLISNNSSGLGVSRQSKAGLVGSNKSVGGLTGNHMYVPAPANYGKSSISTHGMGYRRVL